MIDHPLLTFSSFHYPLSSSVLIQCLLVNLIMMNDSQLRKAWHAGKAYQQFTIRGVWISFTSGNMWTNL